MTTPFRAVFLIFVALLMPPDAQSCSRDIGEIDENFEEAVAAFRIRVSATELRPSAEPDFSGIEEQEEVTDDEIAEFVEEIIENRRRLNRCQ